MQMQTAADADTEKNPCKCLMLLLYCFRDSIRELYVVYDVCIMYRIGYSRISISRLIDVPYNNKLKSSMHTVCIWARNWQELLYNRKSEVRSVSVFVSVFFGIIRVSTNQNRICYIRYLFLVRSRNSFVSFDIVNFSLATGKF